MNVDNHAIQPHPVFYKKIWWTLTAVFRAANGWVLQYFTLKNNDAVRRYQYRRLKKLINHAWNNVPFYRRYWQEHGFEPEMFKTLDDMKLIPVINKNTVIAGGKDFLARDVDKSRLEIITTGGTTGMPMEFYIDNYRARAKEMAHQLYAARHIWGYRLGLDRCVVLRGARIGENLTSKGIFWEKSDRERGLVMSSFHLLEENYEAYINKIRDYKPKFIRAYPSSIVALCTLMKKHGDKGIKGLKGVLCSSENIYEWQRNLVREVLGVEIYGQYGHSEKATVAFEKEGVFVFPPRYGYTEFIEGEGGLHVVATGFDLDAFPFIRYDTGDIVEAGGAVKGYPQVARRIVGRQQDFLIDRNGDRVPFTCSDEVFWGIDGIVAYQYVQDTVGKLTINIQTDSGFDPDSIQVMLKSAKEMFLNFDISVVVVPDIPKTKAGKFRYLIQSL